MNYAELAQRYWDLAEQEELAANWRKDQIAHEETRRIEQMRQWNPLMRINAAFAAYLEIRIDKAVTRDREYRNHIGLQRHYLRKSNAATNQAHLHGQSLVQFDYEDGDQ